MPLHITFLFFTISLHIDWFLEEVYIYAQVTFWVQLWMFYEHGSLVAYDQSETFDVICDLQKCLGVLGDNNLLLHRMKSYIDREVRCNYNVHTSVYKHFNGYRTLCSCPGGVTVTNCSVLYCSKAVRMPSWKTTGFVHKPTIKNWLMWSKYFNPSSLPMRLGSKTFVYIPLNTSLTSPGGLSSKNFPNFFSSLRKAIMQNKKRGQWAALSSTVELRDGGLSWEEAGNGIK